MSLWSFIEDRCKAKGIKPFDLVDAGVSRATLYRIQDGGTPGDRVKAQLSVGLGCSIGEINEAISQADQTTPFGETVKKTKKKESVMETVDKLEKMVSEKPYVTPGPADEEPAEVFTDEPETDTDSMVLAVEEYKEQLRGQIIKHMMEAEPGTTIEQLWIQIGQMVAKDVL